MHSSLVSFLDFRFFWKRRVLQLGAAAWPRSLIFIFLRSRACSISRAWHFAILLSTALACSLGCGPSSGFAECFEAFVFSFRRKTTKIPFLRTFSRIGDGMGWLHGCTTNTRSKRKMHFRNHKCIIMNFRISKNRLSHTRERTFKSLCNQPTPGQINNLLL